MELSVLKQQLVDQPPILLSDPVPDTFTFPHSNSVDRSSTETVDKPNIASSSASNQSPGNQIPSSSASNVVPPENRIPVSLASSIRPEIQVPTSPFVSSPQYTQPSTSSNSSLVTDASNVSNASPLSPPTPAVGKINYSDNESDILGYGSGGTIVRKGTFGPRDVAVKIISDLKDKSEAENEIDKLIQCDNHDNIIRYYHSEKTPNGFHIALELCEKNTLADWVDDPDCFKLVIDPLDVLKQATQGLGFLHQLKRKIIHRDLKPSNILFTIRENKAIVKISDFGISRATSYGQTKKTYTSFGGTFGWIAPEILEAESVKTKSRSRRSRTGATKFQMTPKIDIFSLGCIYYFVLTKGDHPYGDDDDSKNFHIKNGNTQLKTKYDSLRLQCNLSLVKIMIAKDPDTRPNTEYILAHPMFWDHKKMIDFIDDVSNFVRRPIPSNKDLCDKCVAKLETNYFPKISNGSPEGWFGSLDSELKKHFLERYQEADKHKAIELVRKIRNLKHHYDEKNNVVIKKLIRELPDDFMISWLKMFPSLINEMRDAFDDLKARESFKCYFY